MMYPVCVRLPENPELATALWTVLEVGMLQQHHRRGTRALSPMHRQHVDTLLTLLRSKLSGSADHPGSVWVERREIAGLLVLVDDGLQALSNRLEDNGSAQLYAEAIHGFLGEIRRHLPTPRRPVSRQSPAVLPQRVMAVASGR